MDQFANENADIFNEEPNKKEHIVVRIFKWLGIGIIVIICGLLMYSCICSIDHGIVDKVLMNEAFYDEYEKAPDELVVEQYGMNSPWIAITEGRLLEFNNLYYIPKLNQLQVSVKYNEDIKYSKNDEMPLVFKLTDDEGNEYTDYFVAFAERSKYEYVRICFENVDLYKRETDENGEFLRKKLTLTVDMLDKNGKSRQDDKFYFPYSKQLYDGRNVSKPVKYKVEK